mgnify:CR=1 FL=1|tara:strand:- start:3 stop:206 length:204 start_codon:yes stop_codon:yes gene_type:complete
MNLQETTIISMQGMMIWNIIAFSLGIIITMVVSLYTTDSVKKQEYFKGYEDGMNNAKQIFNEVFRKS